jgi:hypothetical protein
MDLQTPNPDKVDKNGHRLATASVAAFTLLSIAIVAFLYYQNQQLKEMLASCRVLPTPAPLASPTLAPSPEATIVATASASPKSKVTIKYECPAGGYIDCMPKIDQAANPNCTSEAISWYKENCPDFKGMAY